MSSTADIVLPWDEKAAPSPHSLDGPLLETPVRATEATRLPGRSRAFQGSEAQPQDDAGNDGKTDRLETLCIWGLLRQSKREEKLEAAYRLMPLRRQRQT